MHRKWPTCSTRGFSIVFPLFSLHIRSMWETICDANHIPVHIPQTVNFCPNFPESPFLELQTRKLHPLPISENFRLEMTKVYFEIPPHFWKTSDLRWPKFTQKYPPLPISENFRFEMTKVYSKIPPPISENFQFEMTSLLRNTPPPFQKTSDLRWPKFTPKYPPFWKTSDLRWPKFTLKYPPPPPYFGKLQIWDDQSLLQNTPHPISENPGDRMLRLICNPQGYHSFWI